MIKNVYTKRNGEKIAQHLPQKAYNAYINIDPFTIYATSDDTESAGICTTGAIQAGNLSFSELVELLEGLSN